MAAGDGHSESADGLLGNKVLNKIQTAIKLRWMSISITKFCWNNSQKHMDVDGLMNYCFKN